MYLNMKNIEKCILSLSNMITLMTCCLIFFFPGKAHNILKYTVALRTNVHTTTTIKICVPFFPEFSATERTPFLAESRYPAPPA